MLLEQAAFSVAILAIIAIAMMSLIALAGLVASRYSTSILIYRRPITTATFELLWTASVLTRWTPGYLSPFWIWHALDSLHYASRAVGEGVPRLVNISDLTTRGSVQQRLENASHAIGRLGRDIVLGGVGEREVVARELVKAAAALLSQSYSALPESTDEQEAERQQETLRAVRSRIRLTVRDVLVAVLPLSVIKTIELTPVSLPAESGSLLTTLAAAWLIIKILAAIDPKYRDSLADARALAGDLQPMRSSNPPP